MQRFSLDRGRFAGHPRRGFPHPSGGSPSPSKSPPEGGDPTPQGAGACRPPVSPSGSPSTPRGTPTGFPRLRRLPLLSLFGNGRGQAKRAGAAAPERGWKKIKVVAPIAAVGRQRWKCGEGGAVGGQGWGQPVGSPPGCPRGVPASVHGPAKPPTGRVAISTSPPPGGPTRPPLGAFFAPQGSRLPFQDWDYSPGM